MRANRSRSEKSARGRMLSALVLMLLALAAWCFARDSITDPQSAAVIQKLFVQAGQAYDDGDLAASIDGYEQVLDTGHSAPELLFNLGNAYFRHGDLPLAIASYRRAWYLSPRDPDIDANFRFALGAAGASPPTVSPHEAFFEHFNASEWAAVAVASYWIAALAAAVWLLFYRARPAARTVAVSALCVLILALAAERHWRTFIGRPEAVLTVRKEKALFAPLEKSTAHFELPQGSIVRILEESETWVKIELDGKEGWIPETSCKKVSSWLMI